MMINIWWLIRTCWTSWTQGTQVSGETSRTCLDFSDATFVMAEEEEVKKEEEQRGGGKLIKTCRRNQTNRLKTFKPNQTWVTWTWRTWSHPSSRRIISMSMNITTWATNIQVRAASPVLLCPVLSSSVLSSSVLSSSGFVLFLWLCPPLTWFGVLCCRGFGPERQNQEGGQWEHKPTQSCRTREENRGEASKQRQEGQGVKPEVKRLKST